MRAQPNRLPPGTAFSGRAIERSAPLTFGLNGEEVCGFSGDTVLSAALACGILTAGTHLGAPLALDERFSPPTALLGRPDAVLPMGLMPAIDGASYVTLGARSPTTGPGGPLDRVLRLVLGPRRTLGHRFDGGSGIYGPWLEAPPAETRQCDLAVVGGGVAGLAAALAAAEAGERVVVVEAMPDLGGVAGYFGTSEGEEPVDELVAGLVRRVSDGTGIEVMTGAQVQSLDGTSLRIHRVEGPVGRIVRVLARRVVLAPGAAHVLPVFAGNRSPGVTGVLMAWRRAILHGVWIGARTLLSTATNHAYRLAVALANAGVRIERIYDGRPMPASRYIDFAKATGLPLSFGLVPHEARPVGHGLVGLHVAFGSPHEAGEPSAAPVWTEQLLVCGGWQPELMLWHMAGGSSRWDDAAGWLEPAGRLPEVALAGAAAGYRGTRACMASGGAAVGQLLGRDTAAIEDPRIDAIYETPDGPTPVSGRRRLWPAFLDGGASLAMLPPLRRAGLPAAPGRNAAPAIEDHPRFMTTAEVAALVRLGTVSPAQAPAVARERSVAPMPLVSEPVATPAAPPPARSWLDGRFGAGPATWLIAAGEARAFMPGSLIFPSSEPADPLAAVGVVLAPAGAGRAQALIGGGAGAAGHTLVVRDAGGPVRVRLIEQVKGI